MHVWVIDLDAPDPPAGHLDCLADEERARAARFRGDELARRFAVGRAALRHILARYGSGPPPLIRFGHNSYGRPFVAGRNRTLDFNFSGSGGLAVCAVVRRRSIGVDIERLRQIPDAASIAQQRFSRWEQRMLAFGAGPPDGDGFQHAFLAAWTRKEAFIKAIGRGLSQPLDSFSVTLLPGQTPRLLQVPADRPGPWSLLSFAPAAGYLAALVVRGRGLRASLFPWRWPPRV